MNLPDKFWINFRETPKKIWTFCRKIVKKCEINLWESASVEKLRKNLIKFGKNMEKFWKRFYENTEKVFRNVRNK